MNPDPLFRRGEMTKVRSPQRGRCVSARIGDVASPTAIFPTYSLLDSLEVDLLESDDESMVVLALKRV